MVYIKIIVATIALGVVSPQIALAGEKGRIMDDAFPKAVVAPVTACKPYSPPPKYSVKTHIPFYTSLPVIVKTTYDWSEVDASFVSKEGRFYVIRLPAIYHKDVLSNLLVEAFEASNAIMRSTKTSLNSLLPESLKKYDTGESLYKALLKQHHISDKLGRVLLQSYVFRHEMAHVWLMDRLIDDPKPFKNVLPIIERDRASLFARTHNQQVEYMLHGGTNFFEDSSTREAFADFYAFSVLNNFRDRENFTQIRQFLLRVVGLYRFLNLSYQMYCDNPILKASNGLCNIIDGHPATLASILWLWDHENTLPETDTPKAFNQFANSLGSYFGGVNGLSTYNLNLYTQNIFKLSQYLTKGSMFH